MMRTHGRARAEHVAHEPIGAQVERYLAAVRELTGRAPNLLAQHPAIPRLSLHAACYLADLEVVREWLEREPADEAFA